ncbi:MAG: nucleotide exchange factor GrpE [Cyanophyceae cyanobacterium]
MIDEENQTEETVEATEPTDPSATADSTGDDTSSETPPEVVSPEITSPEEDADMDPITGEAVAEGADEAIAPEVVAEGSEEAPATLDDLDIDDSVEDTTDTVPDTTAGVEETASYQAAMTDLMREMEGLRAQLENSTGQYARLSADFENFRKRTQKEREEQAEKIKCDTIRELLAVVDNFERARTLIKPQNDSETNIHKSYQGIYKQLVDSLKRLGVSPMRPQGQEFDPNLHEAVMREASEEYPEDVVIEELQRGYTIGDRVLRHAMVKVAAPGSSGGS